MTPLSTGRLSALATSEVTVPPLIPMKACLTSPLVARSSASDRVDRDREADADVAVAPTAGRIWELIPITLPSASISGPPELPGLIAASVWITWEMEKPLGAWIWRCSAETMPLVTVRSSPNGLPIATTGSPTSASGGLAQGQRVEFVAGTRP